MGDIAINVENVSKIYGKDKVLDSINLKAEYGKIYGIIGRNGSGKTMLLKCICGLTKVSEGTICVKEKLVGKDVDIPKGVGVIIETPGFLNEFTGYKNLKLLAMIQNKIGDNEIKDILKKVGLKSNSKKCVGKYSLGMRQRLGIAQALMENPDILLLDEPMNGLDNQGVEEIRNLLLELKKNKKLIILASHSKEDIEVLCDEVYELDHGKIINKKTKLHE
ncbi:MAG: ATP-binding cassette domain-containing protein [Lachnotalea sp.]